ncbi:MAG TPA: PEP-CTERM sorting domain-containing protein [Terriglobales bacterium]|nr:PEP-CTERM sorting domain-containing protein [Terriglobales bacterium]
MKRLILALLATAIVACAVPPASAQTDIDLNTSLPGSGRVAFFATGGGNFTLDMCSHVTNGVCIGNNFSGTATGEGQLAGDNGFYTLTGGGVTGTLTSAQNCIVCTWSLSGPAIGFDFYSGANKTGTDWLNGSFQLVSMTQTKNINGSSFNQFVTLNFTPTGGILKQYFTSGGFIKLNVEFTTAKSIETIPKGQGRFGWVFDGSVTPTPEPGTMALLGSGLLLVGGLLRRKFGA